MKKFLLILAAVMATSATALAQDAAGSDTAQVSSGGTHHASHSQSSIAIELQGRLPVLNILNGDAPFLAIGADSRPSVLVSPVTLGVRLLDTRLFVGLGVGWYSQKLKDCPGGGLPCTTDKVHGFSLSPTASYDVLSRGAARLYPIGMLNLGRLGTTKAEMGGMSMTTDGNFFIGMNVGVGIRADFNDVFSVGTEWGWGFQHVKNPNPNPGEKQTLFGQGAWGTIFLSARIGL